MKKIIFSVFVAGLLSACNTDKSPEWEYKIVQLNENLTLQETANRIAGTMTGTNKDEVLFPIKFEDPTSELNKMGQQGWELVNVYTTTETVFPNMGDPNYHTGIKENTRTETVNFVFKRLKKKQSSKPKAITDTNTATPDSVVVVEEACFTDTAAVVEESAY